MFVVEESDHETYSLGAAIVSRLGGFLDWIWYQSRLSSSIEKRGTGREERERERKRERERERKRERERGF